MTTQAQQFQTAKPYPHLVVDHYLAEANACAEAFPKADWKGWTTQYNNPLEIKRACNNATQMPLPLQKLVQFFTQNKEHLAWLRNVTGIDDLEPDWHLHGGGLHQMPRGGKLDMHLDYSIHPVSKMERRINLILYLTKDWQETYGGHLELWDAEMKQCHTKIAPVFNRMVIMQTSDLSYHGVPDPIGCPPGMNRNSVAIYYVSKPRDVVHRPKAQFFARPSDPPSAFLDKLRAIRSERIITKEDLYDWPEEQKRIQALIGTRPPPLIVPEYSIVNAKGEQVPMPRELAAFYNEDGLKLLRSLCIQ